MNRARTILFNKSADQTESSQDRASWYTPGFSDGLGDRLLMFDNTSASSLELLRFKPEFGGDAAFEEALRTRVDQLANFTHPSIAKVRAVEQLGDDEGLALVSNQTAGRRLSDAIRDARGPTFAMELIRQLVPVLAALQDQGPDIAHGALSADRIIITPEGRLVIVEHVLGSALDSLQMSATRARADLGLAVPAFGDAAKFDTGTDVIQLAFISLSLLLGRRLDPTVYPEKGLAMLEEYPWAPSSARRRHRGCANGSSARYSSTDSPSRRHARRRTR